MFFGFLSENALSKTVNLEPAVQKNGFRVYRTRSDERDFLLDLDDMTLLFRGRIYGTKDLQKLFWRLLEGYGRDGDAGNIFRALEGDFCLIIMDHKREVAYMGRDRFARGEVYWHIGESLSFFTHPREFFREVGFRPSLNIGPLWDRFAIGAITPPETVYRDVYTTVAGEFVRTDRKGQVERVPYWSPLQYVTNGPCDKMEDLNTFVADLRSCFTRKVAEEIAPYKKLGVGLSGGMDSAAITGAARKAFTGDMVAVTVGPDGPRSRDLPKARKSAALNHIRQIEYYPKATDLDDFPLLMGGLPQPFRAGSRFMNHQIAKRVRREGGECVLWGFGADLIFGNAGYCKHLLEGGDGRIPACLTAPLLRTLRILPQSRPVVALTHKLIWYQNNGDKGLGEKYFRVMKKPRFYQERRLFRKEFLDLGREQEIRQRIDGILDRRDAWLVERLIEADFKVVHIYQQVSGAHQTCRLDGLDAIITYYNADYAELNLKAADSIRRMGDWNKYALREAYQSLVHPDIFRGHRGACVLRWDEMISGPFRQAVIRYLSSSPIIKTVFRTGELPRLNRLIKHPGLMYLNLLGLAVWYEVNFKGASPETPLSSLLDYRWQSQDHHHAFQTGATN